MSNFITAFSITLSVVLLLDNVIPNKSHSYTKCIGEPLKYSGATFTILRRLKIIYFVFETLNKMSYVLEKLPHCSNISGNLAPDGVSSVMPSIYINTPVNKPFHMTAHTNMSEP